ncbi:hypothetical protein ACFFLM_07995 [Deinococcus oregonensis]|uniref:Uncharacterized protein n=1 Tax=Deinococcus oregonensis TaxID=1805970 RepID=A0ABV6AWP1_9DEIO
MTVLSKQDIYERLQTKLADSGVASTTARQYAAQFIDALEHGRHLTFRDLGQVHLEGEDVILEPLVAVSDAPSSASWRLSPAASPPPAFTVEEEASVLQLMNGGYPRRTAEKLVLSSQQALQST